MGGGSAIEVHPRGPVHGGDDPPDVQKRHLFEAVQGHEHRVGDPIELPHDGGAPALHHPRIAVEGHHAIAGRRAMTAKSGRALEESVVALATAQGAVREDEGLSVCGRVHVRMSQR